MTRRRRSALLPSSMLLLAIGCAAFFSRAGVRGPRAGEAEVRHHPEFPVMHILSLPGDRFLLWHGAGWIQAGTAAGAWSPVARLPLRGIVDVRAYADGILVAGSLNEKTSTVLLVGVDGRERARWAFPSEVFGLVVDDRGRAASTREGLVPLLDGGALGSPERLEGGGPAPYGNPPALVARRGSGTVVCRARDMSLEHAAPGQCDRRGDHVWHLQGGFAAPPLACGDWLVATEWERAWRIKVYALDTGRPTTPLPLPVQPVVACAGDGELFVGERRLALFKLPGRRPVWTGQVTGAQIVDLAASENAIAYRADDSPDVVIIPRPRPR